MQKTILFIFFFIHITCFSKSDDKSLLRGKVFDFNNKPLQGATIYIPDLKLTTFTNKDGFYKTNFLSKGTYLIEISFIGYESVIEQINIAGETEKNFKLKESFTEQEAIVVTGVSSATKLKNSPQSISIVTKNDFNRISSTNLIDALSKSVSGFSSITTGASISKPVIRGLGYNRLITMHDGVRQEGQQWGEEHGIEIDEASVQKAEILKGAASLMYGSDAIAGVLHLLTYQPLQQGTQKGNLSLGYLNNNDIFSIHGSYGAHYKNGFNWYAYKSLKDAGNYSNAADGKVLNSKFKENNFGINIGLQKHWGYTQLMFSNYYQKVGIIDGERDSATGKFILFSGEPQQRIASKDDLENRQYNVPFQIINHLKITSNSSFILKSGKLNTTFGFQQNKREEFGHLPVSNVADLYFDLRTFTYNAQLQLNEKKGYKFSFGINGMQQTNLNRYIVGKDLLIPDYNLFDFGIYAILNKKYNKAIINGGLRFNSRNLKSNEFLLGTEQKFAANNKVYQNIAGSLGISYFLNDNLTLKANVARGFRAPTVTELSSNGAHEGTFRYEIGDVNLLPENSWQFDFGLEKTSNEFTIAANLFFNRIDNFIYSSKLLSVNGGDSLIEKAGKFETVFKFKQQDALLFGFEANADYHPKFLKWFTFKNTFSYVKGTFVKEVFGTSNLPLIPQPRLLNELKASFRNINNKINNAYLKLELDNFFNQNNFFTAFNTETQTIGYSLLNFGFGGDLQKKGKTFCSLFFSINNITDVVYQNHLSRLKYTSINNTTNRQGVFNMGRNFSVKLNFSIF